MQNNRPKNKTKDKPKPDTSDAADPKLQGWRARQCTATVTDGIVTLIGQGQTPFLGVAAAAEGPATMKFRARSAVGGEGKVEWIAPGKNPPPGKSLPFRMKSGDWQEITVEVPAEGAIGILRLYLPAQKQPVELDRIELAGKAKPKRWDF